MIGDVIALYLNNDHVVAMALTGGILAFWGYLAVKEIKDD